jgi:hypothetical protein
MVDVQRVFRFILRCVGVVAVCIFGLILAMLFSMLILAGIIVTSWHVLTYIETSQLEVIYSGQEDMNRYIEAIQANLREQTIQQCFAVSSTERALEACFLLSVYLERPVNETFYQLLDKEWPIEYKDKQQNSTALFECVRHLNQMSPSAMVHDVPRALPFRWCVYDAVRMGVYEPDACDVLTSTQTYYGSATAAKTYCQQQIIAEQKRWNTVKCHMTIPIIDRSVHHRTM